MLIKYTHLMHYTTKTAEEFNKKVKRERRINILYNITKRLKKFFNINPLNQLFIRQRINLLKI